MSAPARLLTADELVRVANLRAMVMATVPEAVEFIQALYTEGLIQGWRAVTYVGPRRDIPNTFSGPFLRGDEIMKGNQQ